MDSRRVSNKRSSKRELLHAKAWSFLEPDDRPATTASMRQASERQVQELGNLWGIVEGVVENLEAKRTVPGCNFTYASTAEHPPASMQASVEFCAQGFTFARYPPQLMPRSHFESPVGAPGVQPFMDSLSPAIRLKVQGVYNPALLPLSMREEEDSSRARSSALRLEKKRRRYSGVVVVMLNDTKGFVHAERLLPHHPREQHADHTLRAPEGEPAPPAFLEDGHPPGTVLFFNTDDDDATRDQLKPKPRLNEGARVTFVLTETGHDQVATGIQLASHEEDAPDILQVPSPPFKLTVQPPAASARKSPRSSLLLREAAKKRHAAGAGPLHDVPSSHRRVSISPRRDPTRGQTLMDLQAHSGPRTPSADSKPSSDNERENPLKRLTNFVLAARRVALLGASTKKKRSPRLPVDSPVHEKQVLVHQPHVAVPTSLFELVVSRLTTSHDERRARMKEQLPYLDLSASRTDFYRGYRGHVVDRSAGTPPDCLPGPEQGFPTPTPPKAAKQQCSR
ncbi:hypothetical protein DIPPA_09300 [Diplonema papillatum]|nr:hypothetical protein DIPPA_09300 [Diplonema papillatum]